MESYEKKEIIILFGEMGSGKNYWGEKFSQQLNYSFFDGDTVATPEMLRKVSKFLPLSKDLLNDYLIVLRNEIINRASEPSYGLVVAQALYNDQNRINLKNALEATGEFTVNFFWIQTTFIQNMKQVFSRPKGFRWTLYWLLSKPWFQKPTHKHCPYKHNLVG